jgi:hypothetical protein
VPPGKIARPAEMGVKEDKELAEAKEFANKISQKE